MVSDFKPDIWRLQAQFNTEGLVSALASDDSGIRRRAAAALRALGAVDTIPQLQIALDNETDPETRDNILAALTALKAEQKRRTESHPAQPEEEISPEVEAALNRLRSSNMGEVIEAVQELGELGDKIAVPTLMVIFTNPKVPIKLRLVAAEALIKLESAPVEVTLLAALRSPEWRVRRNGAAILGQLRAEWAIEPLAKALRDENEVVRKTAYAALKHIGTSEATKAVMEVRRSVTQLREQAAQTQTQEQPSKLDTQNIVWPSRKKKTEEEEELGADHPTLAPTKPFDPTMIDEARRQINEMRRRRAEAGENPDDDSEMDSED